MKKGRFYEAAFLVLLFLYKPAVEHCSFIRYTNHKYY